MWVCTVCHMYIPSKSLLKLHLLNHCKLHLITALTKRSRSRSLRSNSTLTREMSQVLRAKASKRKRTSNESVDLKLQFSEQYKKSKENITMEPNLKENCKLLYEKLRAETSTLMEISNINFSECKMDTDILDYVQDETIVDQDTSESDGENSSVATTRENVVDTIGDVSIDDEEVLPIIDSQDVPTAEDPLLENNIDNICMSPLIGENILDGNIIKTEDCKLESENGNELTESESSGSAVIFCSMCSYMFESNEKLKEHILRHADSCIFCTDYDITKICKDHNNCYIRLYMCLFCDTSFKVKSLLKQHLQEHIDRNVTNHILELEEIYLQNQPCTSSQALAFDRERQGTSNMSPGFLTMCLNYLGPLADHERIYCYVCRKNFPNPTDLQTHSDNMHC